MDYEQAIDNIGGCGFYQKFMLSFLYSCTILDGLQIGSMIFIAPTLKHRCAIPGYPNDTYEVHSDSHEEMINRYIPSRTTEGEINYYGCSIYANETTNGNFTKRSCHSWVYDKTNTHNSITSQLDLVCDKSNLGNHTITFFFLGYLFAMVVTGILSDRFGRKKVIIISLFLQGSSGICTALISNIYGIYILRFLTAVGGAGSYIPSVVFAAEVSSIKSRMKTSIAIQATFTVGYMIMAVLSYFIRTWRLLLILISIPSLVLATLYLWFLDESPRWLLNKKRNADAKIILKKMAKLNKSSFCADQEIKISTVNTGQVQLWKIFTIPQLLKRTIILMINWMVVSMVYFGITLNVGQLYGNLYLNFFLNSVVEFPAYLACVLLLNRIGRRKMYGGLMILTGLGCSSGIFPVLFGTKAHRWILTLTSIISRLFITAAFGIIYLFTLELYPTCIRNGALGAMSTWARLGGSLAPYTVNLTSGMSNKLGMIIPMIIMGVLSIFSGLISFILPETNNRKMMDDFSDISKSGKLERAVKKEENKEETVPMTGLKPQQDDEC